MPRISTPTHATKNSILASDLFEEDAALDVNEFTAQSAGRKRKRDEDGKKENDQQLGKEHRVPNKRALAKKKRNAEKAVIDEAAVSDTDILLSNNLGGGEREFLFRTKIRLTNSTVRMFNSIIKPAIDKSIHLDEKKRKELVFECIKRVRRHRGRILKYTHGVGLHVASDEHISLCIRSYLPKPGSKKYERLVQERSFGNEEGNISNSWLAKLEQLEKHKEKCGQVQQESVTDKTLRSWLKVQMRNYSLMVNGKHSSMTFSKFKRLMDIGVVFDQGSGWDQLYGRLKTFSEKHGHFEVEKEIDGDDELYEFALSQRLFLNNFNPECTNVMDKIRHEKLVAINFSKDHIHRNKKRSKKQNTCDKKEPCVSTSAHRKPESAMSKGWALMTTMVFEQRSLRCKGAGQVEDMIRML
mmetsp:Transcript_21973/g.33550  ORF Transcript_21973/g.33550 Transcript_21973/m.33550 type:complete len:412 (+) Transcript_21973:208-1443(+)